MFAGVVLARDSYWSGGGARWWRPSRAVVLWSAARWREWAGGPKSVW